MRVQRTFTVVPPPGPAERTAVDNRPMTSKQVRKAYREANRVPRVSKAELRRQERAEQERIRRELEKEKAAGKAKAQREKKRAKEQAEREEKKKKGLPLVNVRPSQDLIARFVRGNGSGSKRDFNGRDASAAPVLLTVEESEEEEDHLPSPKRLCNKEQQVDEVCEEPEQEEVAAVLALEEPPKHDNAQLDDESATEDEFLDEFEVMSDDEICKLSINAVIAKNEMDDTEDCAPKEPVAMPGDEGKGMLDETTLRQPDSPVSIKNPEPIAPQEFDLISDDEEDLELEMLALDVVLTSQQRLSKEPGQTPLPQKPETSVRTATGCETDLKLAAALPHQANREMSPQDDLACLMPPPPLPAAPQRSRSHTSPVAMRPQAPPLSTQQILYNMDDFFPSSSQQQAELEEEETTLISQHTKSGSMPAPQAASPVAEKPSSLPVEAVSSSPATPKPFFTASGTNERIAVALLHSRRTAEREEEERRRAAELEVLALEEAKKREAERLARERRAGDKPTTTAESTKMKALEKPQVPRLMRPVAAASPQFSTGKAFIPNANRGPSKAMTQRRPLAETRANAALPAKLPAAAEMNKRAPFPGTISRQQSSPPTTANKPVPPKAQSGLFRPNDHNTPVKAPDKENTTALELDEFKDLMASQESEFGGSWMDELATELSL
ncbi:hypothetical protein J3F83DRAFT_749303 [Trichoderma novae-zelandiae]